MSDNLTKFIGASINLISYISSSYAAKLAVYLFSKPRNAKLDKEAITYLSRAKQEDLTFENFNIKTYTWSGSKGIILLVHGWDSNSFRWKDLIALLQKENYNIVALDAPAHGASGNNIFNAPLYSECLKIVIDKFKPDTIIGHSVGGTASVIALENHNLPSIKKIALLGAPSNLAVSVGNYVKMMKYNKRVENAMNAYYLKHFNHLPEFYCVGNFFKNIKAKGLIIHDKKDRIISFKEALDINRAYKNSELIKTIGFGHGLKSDKVYQHILDFLND